MNPGYGNALFGNDLNNWFRAGSYETVGKNPNPVTLNAPPNCDGWGVVQIANARGNNNSYAVQIFQPANDVGSYGKALFYRYWRDSWSDWKPFATATPAESYNLSLSDGISVQDGLSAVYSKDQFGRVVVHGNLVGQMQNGSVIATLPAGFRPIYKLEMPATCDFTAGRIQVNSAGEIRVMSQLSECSSLYFLAVFVAGG